MSETAIESGSQPEVVPSTTEAAPTPAPEPAKPDPSVTASGEKLDRVTRNWRALEKDRDYWRELAVANSRKPQDSPPAASEPAKADRLRTLADFEYDEGRYQTYLFEQTAVRATEVAERRLKEASERDAAQRRQASFTTREAKYAEGVEDYYEVTRDQSVPITTTMAEVIAESDDGPALAYHLAKNVAVAEQIARLSPLAAARELGRIEARLANEREKAEAEKKRVSQAPPPPPKVEGADAKVEKDPSEMTDLEFKKWREKQITARRSRVT